MTTLSSVATLLSELEQVNLICRREERTRTGLKDLCSSILKNFARAKESVDFANVEPSQSTISASYNLGALAHVNAGDLDKGEILSRLSVAVWIAMAERTGRLSWLTHALQPYINLGRLAAMRGDKDFATRIFREVFRFVHSGQNLNLCSFVIPNQARERVLDSDKTIGDVVIQVYVRDSIKAFLVARAYSELLEFLDEIEREPFYKAEEPMPAVMEARARALCGLEEFGNALRVLRDLGNYLVQTTQPYLICHTLTCDIYRRSGNSKHAAHLLQTVASYYPQIKKINAPPAALRNFKYLLALAFVSLDDVVAARQAAVEAFDIADEMGDEPGRLRCLSLITSFESTPETTYEERLRSGADKTLYAIEKAICVYQQGVLAWNSNYQGHGAQLLDSSLQLAKSINNFESNAIARWIESQPRFWRGASNGTTGERLSSQPGLQAVFDTLTGFADEHGAKGILQTIQ